MELGTIAEIVAACASLGALGAAIVAAIHAKRLLTTESGRDELAAERSHSQQARAVSAWCAVQVRPSGAKRFGVVIRNGSDSVIYDLIVVVSGVWGADVEASPIKLVALPPGDYLVLEGGHSADDPDDEDDHEQKGPKRHPRPWGYLAAVAAFDGEVRPVTVAIHRRILALTFTDSGNSRWSRQSDGALAQLDG